MPKAMVAVTSARAALLAFAQLGLVRETLLEEAGLSESELADVDGLLPATRFYRLWEVADRQWGRPGIGLEAGARVPAGAYAVLDYLLATGETLAQGLREFARFFALATRTASYEIDERGDPVSFAMRWRIPPAGIMFQLRDYSLAAVARRVRDAGGGAPLRVALEGPPLASAARYAQLFAAPAELRAGSNALIFAAARWRAPLAHGDALLQSTLRRHAELLLERIGAAPESATERVRCALLRDTRAGIPALAQVARALALGERTLQRQLRLEGTCFEAVANEVRAGLAREYLGDPALDIGEVGYLLGFSEPSAFSRAFRRWSGRSPEAFRRELAAPPASA